MAALTICYSFRKAETWKARNENAQNFFIKTQEMLSDKLSPGLYMGRDVATHMQTFYFECTMRNP